MTVIEAVAWIVGMVLNFAATVSFLVSLTRRREDLEEVRDGLWAAGFTLWFAADVMAGSWWLAGIHGPFAALSVWAWFHDRRKRRRKRAARSLGYKARALLAALARRAREAARPRSVPQPAPGGASCT